jgi:benzoyl-CoA reductase subunit C
MSETLSYFREIVEDSYATFKYAEQWKEKRGFKLLAYYPVYFPEELAYAVGVLPIKLFGGVGRIDPMNSMSRFQSFSCSIPKTVLELVMSGRLNHFDMLVFSNICDLARNLAFVVKRNFGDKFHVIYLHYPMNNTSLAAVNYLKGLYKKLIGELEKITGVKYNPENLNKYIELCNKKRAILNDLFSIRFAKPWIISFDELHTVALASMIMPVDEFVELSQRYLDNIKRKREERPVERLRVLVIGDFCEQPPSQLYRIVELSGAYILQTDYVKNTVWLGQVDTSEEDPIDALARAYVTNQIPLTTRYHLALNKRQYLNNYAKEIRADSIVFFTPKFCEPSIYDYIIYRGALDEVKMPYVRIDYEESMTSFEQPKTSIETFLESLIFEL